MSTASLPPRPADVVPIEEEMRKSYLDYAMSVIVSRALPDVRDGLKPVHRRILYAMREGGYDVGKPFRKSSRIVGDVMGKYHPHGDAAIYDAMVRMAQDFSMRLMLVDKQGNFGSLDGDPPAAMRYTEARLGQPSIALLDAIDKDTVDFRPSYDESGSEPEVLPAQFPNLLVNGAGGIAVGMATNIPPHNLAEVIDACIKLIEEPDTPPLELMDIIQGPDFPTGGTILGVEGIRTAYMTGRGSVLMRGKVERETLKNGREAIVVTEVPYQINKARMVERIAEVVREKRVEGIADLRDESDRDGVRVVIEVKRDADFDVVLNQLYKFTPLQTSFGINMVALNAGRPLVMTLREVLDAFLAFREEVVLRRTAYDLNKARERAHVVFGLAVAIENLDPLIAMIRASADRDTARDALMARDWALSDLGPYLRLADPGHDDNAPPPETYRLSERQANAILDLRLHRLTGLERQKLINELQELAEKIAAFLLILRSRERLQEVMRTELLEVRERFADPRRTVIEAGAFEDINLEDLIQKEDMVVTVTHGGYIKRVPLSTYRAQKRGGKGRAGMATHDDDFLTRLFVANTHTPVLFFSNRGRVYKLKVYKLPLGTPQARGKPMVNLFDALGPGEMITTVMPLPEDEASWADLNVMFATAQGRVRRNDLSDFTFVPTNGKIAMGLEDDDQLIGVQVCDDSHDILLAARGGKCVRFAIDAVRVFKSRSSDGVRGMELAQGDRVVSMTVLEHVEATPDERTAYLSHKRRGESDLPLEGGLPAARFDALEAREQLILTVTVNGYGKRSSAYEYRVTNRGGQGIINILTSERNGAVLATFPVEDDDQVMFVTDKGKVIRIPIHDIRIAGRNTQGVRVFNVDSDEHIVAAERIPGLNGEAEDDTDTDLVEMTSP